MLTNTLEDSDYIIRKATSADAAKLKIVELQASARFEGTGLLESISDPTMCPQRMAALIESEQVWVVCSKSTGEPVGFAAGSVLGQHCMLEEIDVVPEHGGKGLAKALIKQLVAWAKNKGYTTLVLSTFTEVPWNEPFYRRLGFQTIQTEELGNEFIELREHEVKAGLPGEKRVFMRLDLNHEDNPGS